MNVDLGVVFDYLRRRIGAIAVVSLIVAGITYGYLKTHPTYEAKAILILQAPNHNRPAVPFAPDDLQELATSPQVTAETRKAFLAGTGRPTDQTLPCPQTSLLAGKKLMLSARGPDPKAAADYVNLWIEKLTREYDRTLDAGSKTSTPAAPTTKPVAYAIKPLLLPSEPGKPLFGPTRYAVAGFVLSFGLLSVVVLLIGAYTQNKRNTAAPGQDS